MVLRKLLSLAVPAGIAVAAFLHAHAIGSIVEATMTPSSVAPLVAVAHAAAPLPAPNTPKSASAILDRNPFDHVTGPLRPAASGGIATADVDRSDPGAAPPCEGVRAVVAVHSADADASFAALDVGGKRMLQKRGGEVADLRIVYVAEDRVWLERNGVLCQARVFGGLPPAPPPPAAPASGTQSAFEKDIAGKIVKTGPNEFQIDRGAVDRILEAQTELMKTPLVPEKEGDRVVGFRLVRVKPGSVLATLGLESNDRLVSINGIEVTSTERMLEAYGRLRSGVVDRLTIHVVRNGKPTNLDYVVR